MVAFGWFSIWKGAYFTWIAGIIENPICIVGTAPTTSPSASRIFKMIDFTYATFNIASGFPPAIWCSKYCNGYFRRKGAFMAC